jgi:hypothetical protein
MGGRRKEREGKRGDERLSDGEGNQTVRTKPVSAAALFYFHFSKISTVGIGN